jgi:hypothetical protein
LRDLNFAKVDQFCELRLAKFHIRAILAGGKFSGGQSR